MFRAVTEIYIKQNGAGRTRTFLMDFCTAFEANDTWVDLTNQASVKFPKNIYVRDQDDKLYPLGGTNKNVGGFDSETPLFLKGDAITINFGYVYYDKLGNEIKDVPKTPIFTGFITEVISKKPIELKAEDNMYKLKQIAAPNKLYPVKSYTWEQILTELVAGTGFTVNAKLKSDTRIGDFRTQNETVAQVIQRVRDEYHLETYFRGDDLRSGAKVYIDSEAVTNTFIFQQNIISDDLTYKRRDDVVLSAVCYSVNKIEASGTTKTGKNKTTNERLEVLIYWDKAAKAFKYQKKEKGKEYPQNVEGERKTLYFWDVKTTEELYTLGVAELTKFYYTGFKGKFTTFAIPYVKQGDNVQILDNVLPERNGKYKVKTVEYSGGTGGLRQTIILDYKIA
jgi:hypothetical protein